MDAFIRDAVERVTGERPREFDWSESLTTADHFARLLDRTDPRHLDLVFVTDHVNETTDELYPDLVDLAGSEPRLAIGGELQTIVETAPGSFTDAPEILLYGTPDRVRSRGVWHYGINIELLREIHEKCRPEGQVRPELHRALAFCRERGIAHAISHPLDGHFLNLAQTLRAVSSTKFVESVNGGFGSDSTRRLERYMALHNDRAHRRGATGPAADLPASEEPRDIAGWLGARWESAGHSDSEVPVGIVSLGGADAHMGRYDRVCNLWAPPGSPDGAGIPEFVRDMVETPADVFRAEEAIVIEGRGNGWLSVVAEVLALVAVNARRNRATFRGAKRMARLLALGPTLAVQEILHERSHQQVLGDGLDEVLDRVADVRSDTTAATAA